jgi:hypothetical protein
MSSYPRKSLTLSLVLLSLLATTRTAAQSTPTPVQRSLLSGTVRDSTGAALRGVRVTVVGTPRTAYSNDSGQYRLRDMPAGTHTLRFTRIGFAPLERTGVITSESSTTTLDVQLQASTFALSQVTIAPGAYSLLDPTSSSRLALSREALLTAPQLVEDVFRSLNRLPGLSGSDFSSKVRIRNGGVDEQLYTLDGVELLEPYHLKDFDGALSIIDGEVIGGITVTTGGFGATKGNRMAGLVEMQSASPADTRARTAVGLSLSNIRARSEGTFASGRGGWLVSGRRGFLDVVLKLVGEEDPPNPRYSDLFGKVQYQLGDAHQVAIHGLIGSDNLTLRDTDGSRLTSKYANNYLWSTLRSRFGERVGVVTLASISRLTWRRDLVETQGINGVRFIRAQIDDRRSLDALTVKQDWTVDLSPTVSVSFGGEHRNEDADYRYARTQIQRTAVNRDPVVVDSQAVRVALAPDGTRTSGYAALRVRPVSALTLEAGARADRHTWTRQTTASPRINAALALRQGTTVRGAWGQYHQAHALQELSVVDGDTTFARAERAEHRVVSLEQDLGLGWTARLEGYERLIAQPRARFYNVDGTSTSPLPEAELDRVRIAPSSARVRGVELLAQYDHGGRVRGGASVVVSRATAVVNGAELTRPFDEPYAATADVTYRARSGWTFALSWTARAGWPIGTPAFAVDTIAPGRFAPQRIVSTPVLDRRLNNYMRVDARATRAWVTPRGKISAWADVFNLLNRRNERSFEYRWTLTSPTSIAVTAVRNDFLTLLPTLGVTWEF